MVASIPKHYYVGAHMGIYDPNPENGQKWDNETVMPSCFDQIRFDAVDVLHIGHFVSTKDGQFTFGTVNRSKDGHGVGNIAKRFEHIVMQARWMNPNIKIIAEQMYSDDEGFDNLEKGDPAATAKMVDIYTNSVRDFLQTWQTKPNVTYKGTSISMRIDGYDIDHEGSTVKACTKDVLSQLRIKLDKLTQEDPQQRHFIIGLTPASAYAYLDSSMAHSCDIINIQRYSGGVGTTAESYLAAIKGLVPGKLTYGIEIESPRKNDSTNNTIDKIAEIPKLLVDRNKPLRGIWTWRLGSNWVFENLMQIWLYNLVHGTAKTVDGKVPDTQHVKEEWTKNGGA